MNELKLIMQIVSLIVLGYIVYQRSAHANYFRKAGYKTWGFNKVDESYVETKEFTMPNTSWMCKSVYLFGGIEFWWSPGGGFSIFPYIVNALFIGLFAFISIACWQFALFCYAVYFMLARMMF